MAVRGWTAVSDTTAAALLDAVRGLGLAAVVYTDIARDGMLSGPNLEAPAELAEAVGIPVIASGGVGRLEHLVEGVRDGHASAVLAASIFHFGEHSVAEAKAAMAEAGIPVRAA